MTVAELITALEKHPGDMQVVTEPNFYSPALIVDPLYCWPDGSVVSFWDVDGKRDRAERLNWTTKDCLVIDENKEG